jgi:predicted nucleic acid-binding protein
MSMPRGKWVLFDTNVYVAALREGVRGAAFARIRESAPRTFLASVVSAELRAGAVDQTGRSVVLELIDRFERLGRVVTPEARSWSLAGDVLGDIRRHEPGMRDRIARLWNDALIALSARQIGASVVTGNVGDFELLRRFVRFDLEPFET